MPENVPPYVVEITGKYDSVAAFQRLASRSHCIFLDSARRLPTVGRYSFVSCDPFKVVQSADLGALAHCLSECDGERQAELPPFQGGAMGLWSYDLVQSIESVPSCRFDEFRIPAQFVGLYDVVVAFDHKTHRAWLISQGWPEQEPARRRSRATSRAKQFMAWLDDSNPGSSCEVPPIHSAAQIAPQFETRYAGVSSNFNEEAYRQTIKMVVDYIHAGDAFQVNLAQRLLARAETDSTTLYLKLREQNAAPFAGYFDLGEHQVISASPERFLQLRNGRVEARPIKGTRQRSALPEADLFSGAELKASRKDLSENVMIVDLMRNDLSRVCLDDSVAVTKLCGLETYEYVQHLVSVVEGQIDPKYSAVDLIRATFPGGSITGAPKVRAMEIIAELEPTARGAYCGSLGYIGFDGTMDLSILIRTITASQGWWQFPVGGGIVANSDPQAEYEETWHKAEGMLRAIRS